MEIHLLFLNHIRIAIVKMSGPKQILGSMYSPLFTEIIKTQLKFMWNHKTTWLLEAILNRKRKARDNILLSYKKYDKATGIKHDIA